MTRIVAGVVDVVVLRRVGRAWRVLTLERADGTRSPGSWEHVHGRTEPGETPPEAALRELREETGYTPARLYSVTVNPFYLDRFGAVQLAVAFAAVVDSPRFVLGPEHRGGRWVTFAAARKRLAWPRDHELLDHVAWLLRSGDAGVVEDVLRIATPAPRARRR